MGKAERRGEAGRKGREEEKEGQCLRVPISLINTVTKSSLGRTGFISSYSSTSLSIAKGSGVMNSNRPGTWR